MAASTIVAEWPSMLIVSMRLRKPSATLTATVCGSIHLGWHYASDGVVGIAGALLVWRLAGNLRKGRRSVVQLSTPVAGA